MPLARLVLTAFRSHAALTLAPGPGFVVLTGENGAGKTNVLEAVSLLAPGRGLRGATLGEMARRDGPGGLAVAARLDDGVELGTGTLPAAPDRRRVRINGAEATATALGERIALTWLTPAMDRLFTEGASGRRRFLDRLVLALEPGHAHHASRYEAAMRARTKLLAAPEGADPGWLAALEQGMAEHGAAVAAARARLVAALDARLAAAPAGPFARAGLSLGGWEPAAAAAQDALAAELRHGRGRDAAAGRALAGPHRSDLQVLHLDKQVAAALASTGEQKALLLGLILAHAELATAARGLRPILLLDEVAAHLDPRRREALFGRLAATGSQVWMTGTEPAPFTPLGGAASWVALAPDQPASA